MSTAATGFCVFRAGWSGSIALTLSAGSATITPSAHTSAHLVAEQIRSAGVLIDSGFQMSIANSGAYTFRASAAFSLVFSGDNHTRLGFSSASNTGSSAYAAAARPPGSFYPHDSGGMFYTLDIPAPPSRGLPLTDRALLLRTPGTDWKRPAFEFSGLRADVLEALDALDLADTPGKLSIMIGGSAVVHHLGKVRIATHDRIDGWATIRPEVIL